MNTNRQPAGTSIGGQWAPGAAGEVDDSLAETHDDWIAIDEDEAHELPGDDVYSRVEVTRLDDDYNVHVYVDEHFRDCLPEDTQHFDDEATENYLNEREHVIADFIEDNYSQGEIMASLAGSDDHRQVEFTAGLGERPGGVSEAEAYELANATTATRFHNEFDPGTFGSENMSERLRAKLADYDNTPLPPAEVSELERKQFVADFKSAMKQDQLDNWREDIFVQADDADDIEEPTEVSFTPEMERRVEAEAEAYLAKHSGDIDYLIKHPDTPIDGWSNAGSDAYMSAAGYGVGYRDRASATSEASIVADRLSRSSSEHFQSRPRDGGIDFEGSVSVEDGWIVQ